MASELDKISKQLSDNAKAINRLSKRVVDSSTASFADLLTDREIEQLKLLCEHRADLQKFADESMRSDPELMGMYMQFSDANILDCTIMLGGEVVWNSLDPKAEWIIARHENRKLEAKRREIELKKQRIIGYVMSLVSAVVGVVLGWILGKL